MFKSLLFRSCKFLSAPGLALQALLTKTGVKLELLTDIDMLLMTETKIEDEDAMQFIGIQKLITHI